MQIVPTSHPSVKELDVTIAQSLAIAAAEREYRAADARVNALIEAMEEARTDAEVRRLQAECAQAENEVRGAYSRLKAIQDVKTLTLTTPTGPTRPPLNLAA